VQRATRLALMLALAGGPAKAGATKAAGSAGASTSEGLQTSYEGCLRQLDEGEAVKAAGCLERVYHGLIAIDIIARTDLYYVLADLVGAHQAAAEVDPLWLCRARELVSDYTTRERRSPVVRFRARVRAMSKALDRAIAAASTGRELCVAPSGAAPGQPASATEAAPPASEAAASTRAIDGVPTAVAEPAPPVATAAAPGAPRPTAQPGAPRRAAVRQLELTAKTDLMDAGFATTLISVGVAGLGGALWAASIECKARHMTETRCYPDPLPEAVRDAGLALMSVGAAGVVVGLALRWVDQRRQRKLRKTPLPLVGPGSAGLAWRLEF